MGSFFWGANARQREEEGMRLINNGPRVPNDLQSCWSSSFERKKASIRKEEEDPDLTDEMMGMNGIGSHVCMKKV